MYVFKIQFCISLGEIPKRSTGVDCKSIGDAFVGSNPALPTTFTEFSLHIISDTL